MNIFAHGLPGGYASAADRVGELLPTAQKFMRPFVHTRAKARKPSGGTTTLDPGIARRDFLCGQMGSVDCIQQFIRPLLSKRLRQS
jgi:hypothetical protein